MGKTYDRSEKTAKLNQRKVERQIKELSRVSHTRTDDKRVDWTRSLRHVTRACMVILTLASIPHAYAWGHGGNHGHTGHAGTRSGWFKGN